MSKQIIFTILEFFFVIIIMFNWIIVPNSLINAIFLIIGLISIAIVEKVRYN